MPISAILSLCPFCFISWTRRSCASRATMTACEARPISTWRWVARERLREVVPGAGAQRLDAAGDARIAGHHDDDRVLVGLQRRPQDLQPRDLRHVQVDQDDVELPALDRLERLFAATDERHVVSIHLEHAGAALAQRALVVDDEDPDAGLDLAGNGEGIARRRVGGRRARPILLGERVGHPGLLGQDRNAVCGGAPAAEREAMDPLPILPEKW